MPSERYDAAKIGMPKYEAPSPRARSSPLNDPPRYSPRVRWKYHRASFRLNRIAVGEQVQVPP